MLSTRVPRLVRAALVALVLVAGTATVRPVSGWPGPQASGPPAASLPDRLGDAEYWKLASDISEPGGYFRITDNYTSNEREVGPLATMLREAGVKGGVYIGVGPEQNFSYIAAIRPAMAFVIDIRRQAVMQHLMFKAVFEMSADRAAFISLLFSKPKPETLDANTSIQAIWTAFGTVATDRALADRNYARILDRLTGTHKFTLTEDELDQLKAVYQAFTVYGPAISTRGAVAGSFGGGGGNTMTFADLTGWAFDAAGEPQSFLSSDANYQAVKTLHDRGLIVPVSGDFGGPKALRGIGAWVRQRGGVVSAFYVSNVEQYLFQDTKQAEFFDNVSTLPTNDRSVFIRPYAMRRGSSGMPICGISRFLQFVKLGVIRTNNEALACGA
jgi:hypothetical protein